MFGRRKIATIVAEFLGTGVITLVFLTTLRSQLALAFFIALAAGLAVSVMTFAVGRVSGGYFNPALTIGAWFSRQISTVTAIIYIAAQMLGGILAYLLFTYLVNNTLPTAKGHYNGRVLTAEVVGTAIFAFGWAASAAYQRVSAAASATIAGVSYVIGLIAASSTVGLAFLNPALALGARTWVWSTYVLGSVLGAIVGFGLYQLLFFGTEVATAEASASALAVEPAIVTKKISARKSTATKKPARSTAKPKTATSRKRR